MIVTVSGLAGSGTSTAAEALAEELDVDLLSAGEVFRKEAERHGMSLEEFGEHASDNPEIDRRIDERQAEIAEQHDSLVVEGRLAGWMVDAEMKVWLKAPLDVRAERVASREKQSVDEAEAAIESREECERERYEKYYDLDVSDLSIYHLVVDTSVWDPEGVTSILLSGVNSIRWNSS